METLNHLFYHLSINSDIIDVVTEIIDNIENEVNKEISVLSDLLITKNDYTIQSEPTLKLAHLYCVKNKLSGQQAGPLVENYIINHFNMRKNNSSLLTGDATHREKNYEIKVSFGGKDRNKFNYVQLRMNHECSYLLTAYYLSDANVHSFGELFVFRVDKKSIMSIIDKFGSYAHGTVKRLGAINMETISAINNNREYALRVKYMSPCWKELVKFRIDPSNI